MRYEIRIEGVLDEHWSDWFDGMQITPQTDGVTVIAGTVTDQAALHGLLAKIRDLGLPLISVRRDRIDREHHLIDDAVARARAALAHLVDDEVSDPARRAPHDAACELSTLLDVHLGFEDADVLPLYLRHFTEDEYAEVEGRARRLLEVRRLPFTVPWLLGATTPAERERILGRAPPR